MLLFISRLLIKTVSAHIYLFMSETYRLGFRGLNILVLLWTSTLFWNLIFPLQSAAINPVQIYIRPFQHSLTFHFVSYKVYCVH